MMTKLKRYGRIIGFRFMRCILSRQKYAKYLGVNLGKNNMISDYYHWGTEPYLITIGNNCQITHGVKIFTHGGGNVIRVVHPDFDVFGKVCIGDWVYIGTNALIMAGVTIGDNVLVAAGSVVTKSVPPKSVVAGNPAKIICSIDDYYNRNKKYNIHTKGLSYKAKKQKLISMSDEFFIVK